MHKNTVKNIAILLAIAILILTSFSLLPHKHTLTEIPGFLGDVRIVPCGLTNTAFVSSGRRWDAKPIGNASVDPNIWNIREYSGSVTMRCTRGGPLIVENTVSLSVNLMNTYAYHSVIYGPKPWGMPADHPQPLDPVKVPEPVHLYINEKRLIMYTKFKIEKLDQATNFAYDIWITQKPTYIGGPGADDIELMIWVYRGYNASGGGLMPSPAGSIVDRVYIPTLIDGKVVDALWSVWYKPDVEWGGWDYIAFVLTTPATDIAVDLSEILKVMVRTLGRLRPSIYGDGGSKIYSYYINDIEFGTEVFSYRSGSSGIKWTLDVFYLIAFSSSIDSKTALNFVYEKYLKEPTTTTPTQITPTPTSTLTPTTPTPTTTPQTTLTPIPISTTTVTTATNISITIASTVTDIITHTTTIIDNIIKTITRYYVVLETITSTITYTYRSYVEFVETYTKINTITTIENIIKTEIETITETEVEDIIKTTTKTETIKEINWVPTIVVAVAVIAITTTAIAIKHKVKR